MCWELVPSVTMLQVLELLRGGAKWKIACCVTEAVPIWGEVGSSHGIPVKSLEDEFLESKPIQ